MKKERIMPFIIGILTGAIIASAGFLIYNSIVASNAGTNPNQMGQPTGMPDGQQPPEMPDGQQPPEMPNGDNGSQQPPAKPESQS